MKLKILSVFLLSAIIFSACEREELTWGYGEENGPDNWSEISDENKLCKSGNMQSPINIISSLEGDDDIDIQYNDPKFEIVDKGYTFELESKEDNIVEYNNENWYLEQLHFHNPSENQIDGKTYPLEVHFVNKNEQGDILVVSNFIDKGEKNTDFGNTFLQTDGTEVNIDLMKAFNLTGKFYSFDGSLTTPPCSESVKWVVMEEPAVLSEEQIEQFTNKYEENARPVQSLNNRDVYEN